MLYTQKDRHMKAHRYTGKCNFMFIGIWGGIGRKSLIIKWLMFDGWAGNQLEKEYIYSQMSQFNNNGKCMCFSFYVFIFVCFYGNLIIDMTARKLIEPTNFEISFLILKLDHI